MQSAEGALLPSRSLGAQAQNWGALCGPGLSRLYTLHRSPKGGGKGNDGQEISGAVAAPVASAPTPSAFPTQPWKARPLQAENLRLRQQTEWRDAHASLVAIAMRPNRVRIRLL